MTDLIKLAQECGADDCIGNDVLECEPAWILDVAALTAFAARIRADERERCAMVVEDTVEDGSINGNLRIASAIRSAASTPSTPDSFVRAKSK